MLFCSCRHRARDPRAVADGAPVSDVQGPQLLHIEERRAAGLR